MGDNMSMETWFSTTKHFDKWLDKLGSTTRTRIKAHVDKGRDERHFGDHKGVGGGEVSEMRLDFGPGYRLYYTAWEYKGWALMMLLGGDKSTQPSDIKKAKALLPAAKARMEQAIDEELKRREEAKHGK